MGADQTPDPTAWSDDQLDDLLDRLAERAAERDDLNLSGSGPSRRTVLATLLGAGGLGLGATQLGAAASWGSASGTLGSDSEPVDQANIRDLDAKQISVAESGVRASLQSTQSLPSGSFKQVEFDSVSFDDAGEFNSSTGEFTASNNGRYLVVARVQLSGLGNSVPKSIRVAVNGSAVAFRSNTEDGSFATIAVSTIPRLSNGDVVTVEVRQSSGSGATIESSSPATTVSVAQIA